MSISVSRRNAPRRIEKSIVGSRWGTLVIYSRNRKRRMKARCLAEAQSI
jgi:hypothetical protein